MGILDQKWIKLTCETCKESETQKILDKGSMWQGSWWQAPDRFAHFQVEYTGGNEAEPEIILATCTRCRATATVEESYSLHRPEGL